MVTGMIVAAIVLAVALLVFAVRKGCCTSTGSSGGCDADIGGCDGDGGTAGCGGGSN